MPSIDINALNDFVLLEFIRENCLNIGNMRKCFFLYNFNDHNQQTLLILNNMKGSLLHIDIEYYCLNI